MIRRAIFWAGVLLVLLAACSDSDNTPQGDPPILQGFDSMPKEIATLVLTDTPTPVMAGAGETVNVSEPTATLGPPPPTPTMTPYVGIFLGEPTSESGEAVANSISTLAPYVLNPAAGGGMVISSGPIAASSGESSAACSIPVASMFANAYPSVQGQLGCAINGGAAVQLVTQPFERGAMYWRDTRQIYVLASSGQFWQIADSWQEGMPADDPAFSSPPGGMLQPVRGFGLAWRSNQAVRDALGWAALSEAPYTSAWQDFERGAMFIGGGSLVYAIYPSAGQHSGPLVP